MSFGIGRNLPTALATAGIAGGALAGTLDTSAARSATTQTWPAFALVAGLLLVGLVAAEDHLFSAAGHRLATTASRSWILFAGLSLVIVVVTAVLNLDTSVAFLTPVAVHTARRRKQDASYLLAGCLLLSNAGSLLLPGSNLTNLIVTGHLRDSGSTFLAHMALPWVVSCLLTAGVIATMCRGSLGNRVHLEREEDRPRMGLGLLGVAGSMVLMVLLRNPSLPVLGLGVVVATVRAMQRRISGAQVIDILGLPVLVGLFGLAVSMGTLGRAWSGPARMLTHLDPLSTAAVAGGVSVLINNLPAAALLSARSGAHPYSLLVGLDIGPNLFVTGSLAWVLWIRASRGAGGRPPIRRTVAIGLLAAPLALIGAEGALYLAGSVR